MFYLKTNKKIVSFLFLTFFLNLGYAQKNVTFTIEQALSEAVANFQQLKVTQKAIEINQQQKSIFKLNQYPSLTLGATASYIADVEILDKDFSNLMTQEMPKFGNSFTLQATQLVYRGGVFKKHIASYDLKHQIAELALKNDEQTAKHIMVDLLLEKIKFTNQKEIYFNNIQLANNRLENIEQLFNQSKVTRNEVLRVELTIKKFEQALLTIQNNIQIIDYNLAVLLGYPTDTQFNLIDEAITNNEPQDYYLELALSNHPELISVKNQILLADKAVDILRSEKYPTIALFGGYNMQRPIVTRTPAMDLYANAWQVGVSLNYSLDNLVYKTNKRMKLAKIQKQQVSESNIVLIQNINMNVNKSFVKYQEALQQIEISKISAELADENYKMAEDKYFKRTTTQMELLDASYQKLEAEIHFSNDKVNTISQYYNLKFATGTL